MASRPLAADNVVILNDNRTPQSRQVQMTILFPSVLPAANRSPGTAVRRSAPQVETNYVLGIATIW
jgi:hypothetical protein